MSTFELAIPVILKNEKGFNNNNNDRGNWTSGKVGAGELKGTNFGISAMTYPELNIENLTVEQATEIYRRDWWDKYQYGRISVQSIANYVFDMAINMGAEQAHKIAQRAVWAWDCDKRSIVRDDGDLGSISIEAINHVSAMLIAPLRAERAAYHRLIAALHPQMQEDLEGWLNRTYS